MQKLTALSCALFGSVLLGGCVEDEYDEPIYSGRRAYHGSVYVERGVVYDHRPYYYDRRPYYENRPRYYSENSYRYYNSGNYRHYDRDEDWDKKHDDHDQKKHASNHDRTTSEQSKKSKVSAREVHRQIERGHARESWKKKENEDKKKDGD